MNDEDNCIEGWRRAKRVLVIAVKQVVLHRGITLGFLLVAINTVTMVVLENNQNASVYPGTADSIGIPIAGTQILSLVLCPFLILISRISKIIKWLTFSLVAPLLVFLVWCSVSILDLSLCAFMSIFTVFFMLIDLLDIPFPVA